MSIFFNSSLSGLMAAQRALDTTSHNIANVNTPGYSRQRVLQGARLPELYGGTQVGTGVDVLDIQRVYDTFLTDQLRSTATAEQGLASFHQLASRIDGILGNEAAGIPAGMTAFFDAVEGLARDPSSLTARQTVLSEAEALASRFHLLDSQMQGVGDEVNQRLMTGVGIVNGLASTLAGLNERIASSPGGVPSDLLDQRDVLMTQLAEQLDVQYAVQDDGSLNVFVGNGQALVVGDRSFELGVIANEFDPNRLEVAYSSGGQNYPISRNLTGGAIGGALEFRRAMLLPAQDEMGRIAIGLSEAFNNVHGTGMDLSGALGARFFDTGTPVVLASQNNAGAGSVAVTIADATALEPRSYELALAGGSWQLTDLATGQGVAMSGTGTAADPFVVDGLELVVSGPAAAGDRFLLRPSGGSAAGLEVLVDRPEDIAAASLLAATGAAGNSGDVAFGVPRVVDPGDPGLSTPVSIVFDDPSTYRILDSGGAVLVGPTAWAAGSPISFNGWSVDVSGMAAAGDRFDVAPNPSGVGDNSVARELADVARSGLFGATGASLEDLQSGLLSRIGVATRQAGLSLDAQSALRQQTELDIQSVSGVNLDEEAINLIRYQEAYAAAAKAIGVAQTLFQTILDATNN